MGGHCRDMVCFKRITITPVASTDKNKSRESNLGTVGIRIIWTRDEGSN
jgi:hypothetical protein